MNNIFIFILLLFQSCHQFGNSTNNDMVEFKTINQHKIHGKWTVLEKESFYTSMEVNDSTAIVHTRGDTVLYLKVHFDNYALSFFNPNDNSLAYKDSITMIKNSMLTLKTFLGEEYEHKFSLEKDIYGDWQNVNVAAKYKRLRILSDGKMHLFQNDMDSILLDFNYSNGLIVSVDKELMNSYEDSVIHTIDDTLFLKTLYDVGEPQKFRKVNNNVKKDNKD